MTQEDKDLLFKDLSSRLCYGTKMQVYFEDIGGCGYFDEVISSVDVESGYINDRWPEFIKPYLRPMSSMTEEESMKFEGFKMKTINSINVPNSIGLIDWLNSHHFDYRGLIEKGLALEALPDMYHYE